MLDRALYAGRQDFGLVNTDSDYGGPDNHGSAVIKMLRLSNNQWFNRFINTNVCLPNPFLCKV